jgi:hypothetical protein
MGGWAALMLLELILWVILLKQHASVMSIHRKAEKEFFNAETQSQLEVRNWCHRDELNL